MTSEVLDLWITRMQALKSPPAWSSVNAPLYNLLETKGQHVAVVAPTVDIARNAAMYEFFTLAMLGAKGKPNPVDNTIEYTGWLMADVPVPTIVHSARDLSTKIAHRMIRRLYFTCVLQGLAQMPALREVVQAVRLTYLQTRGEVSTVESESSKIADGAGLDWELSLKPSIKGRLTASEEVTLVESLTTKMVRLELMEAEDELLYDLQLLQELSLQVDRHARRIKDKTVPRWECIKGFFTNMYHRIMSEKSELSLRPVFVFEASSLSSVVALMSFLADASALARCHEAKIVVLGIDALHCAIEQDRTMGSPIFRDQFAVGAVGKPPATLSAGNALALDAILARDDQTKFLAPEVRMVLEGMSAKVVKPKAKKAAKRKATAKTTAKTKTEQ